ncbi:MAG: prepilin-type N-terminal cleavage/methylation domain-containing protein [Candidatus Omnitrophica bacterium]|nr:prepilin-type N-terminal cleavage/methylation domain-containing protein [Candidatus Omnitrophota bacterium]
MSSSARKPRRGFTIVELVIVMVVGGIVALMTARLMFRGVNTLVFLPKAVAVNQVSTEVLHHVLEGGLSTLSGLTESLTACVTAPTSPTASIQGLRFATHCNATWPALWLAEQNRIGYIASNGQYVLVRWTGTSIKRSLPPITTTCMTIDAVLPTLTEETLPYHAVADAVTILPPVVNPADQLFRYYNQAGVEVTVVPPVCPPNATIRRVDLAFRAQTGSGLFEEGNAQEDVRSSVAIRVP